MKKKLAVFPIAAVMSFGLIGCGANNQSASQDGYTDTFEPVGYYSNENHQKNNGGNARLLDGADNDGPMVEWMDHTYGLEGQDTNRYDQITGLNQDLTQRKQNRLFHRDDQNFHGHLGYDQKRARSSYFVNYDGNLVEKINSAAKVENVEGVKSIVQGDQVLIALKLKDSKKERETVEKVQRAVQPYLNGKISRVVTNPSLYYRAKVIDNDLKNGWHREY